MNSIKRKLCSRKVTEDNKKFNWLFKSNSILSNIELIVKNIFCIQQSRHQAILTFKIWNWFLCYKAKLVVIRERPKKQPKNNFNPKTTTILSYYYSFTVVTLQLCRDWWSNWLRGSSNTTIWRITVELKWVIESLKKTLFGFLRKSAFTWNSRTSFLIDLSKSKF